MQSVFRNEPFQSLIIEGEKGSGKGFISDVYAGAVLCGEKGRGKRPCGHCHSCMMADAYTHPDLIKIPHEKPKLISVSDVRDGLVNAIQIRPSVSEYRVFILPEAEKMNAQAQNAILKTIEEPPAHAVVILLTTSAGALLDTIRSRCRIMRLQPLQDSQVAAYLKDVLQITGSKAELCTAFARGNIGRARSLALNEDYEEVRQEAVSLLIGMRDADQSELMNAVEEVGKWDLTPEDFFGIMSVWYRDVLLYKAVGDPDRLVFRNQTAAIKDAASQISYEGLENIIKALATAGKRLNAQVNQDLTIELLFLSIQENSR